MEDWRKWKETKTPGAEDAEKKAKVRLCDCHYPASHQRRLTCCVAGIPWLHTSPYSLPPPPSLLYQPFLRQSPGTLQEATEAALEAEKHAAAAQKAAQEGKVELAQQEAQSAKQLATKAQQKAEAAEKASLAHGNPATPKPSVDADS